MATEEITFSRESVLREAAAIVVKAQRQAAETLMPTVQMQTAMQVAQVWATIGAGMQPGETLTVTLRTVEEGA